MGDEWREQMPPFSWPVLAGEDERWEIRAAIDAVVAQGYGMSRDMYAHVLSTFSHSSYPQAPALCLARFDELEKSGRDAFTRNYDPYWDIPLHENLPKPVIELPALPAEKDGNPYQRQPDLFESLGDRQLELFGDAESKSPPKPRKPKSRKKKENGK